MTPLGLFNKQELVWVNYRYHFPVSFLYFFSQNACIWGLHTGCKRENPPLLHNLIEWGAFFAFTPCTLYIVHNFTFINFSQKDNFHLHNYSFGVALEGWIMERKKNQILNHFSFLRIPIYIAWDMGDFVLRASTNYVQIWSQYCLINCLFSDNFTLYLVAIEKCQIYSICYFKMMPAKTKWVTLTMH